jgi:hypothetical protein
MAINLAFPHVLDSAFERVVRAEEHLGDLRERLAYTFRQHENSVAVKFQPNPPHSLLLIRPLNMPTPLRVGVLIGEICYNLRSALDYLIFELAKLDSGVTQNGTQFPIVDSEENFRAKRTIAYLKGISSAHIAAIERLQPYRGCDWTKMLRDFSNPDKHRKFVEIGGQFVAMGYDRLNSSDFDAILAPIRRTPHPIFGKVDVKVFFTGDIYFADRAPIVETLGKIKLKVAETLAEFQPEF